MRLQGALLTHTLDRRNVKKIFDCYECKHEQRCKAVQTECSFKYSSIIFTCVHFYMCIDFGMFKLAGSSYILNVIQQNNVQLNL